MVVPTRATIDGAVVPRTPLAIEVAPKKIVAVRTKTPNRWVVAFIE
jgi:hypothetical protein